MDETNISQMLSQILKNQKTIMTYLLLDNQNKCDALKDTIPEIKPPLSLIASQAECDLAKRGDMENELLLQIKKSDRYL